MLFSEYLTHRPKGQLLKWVGNKYRYAEEIVGSFPKEYNNYYEPFVGTGAILATLNPKNAIAGDNLEPLIDLWNQVKSNPEYVAEFYKQVIEEYKVDKYTTYNRIRERFNENPNGLDLLFLSRTCYGGVVRFTKEGKMSTPLGPHKPISSVAFKARLMEWHERVQTTTFYHSDYKKIMKMAGQGDLIYCDPPYIDSQSILYGAQTFVFKELVEEIFQAKRRGAKVVLSIDGTKRSGKRSVLINFPDNLFERETNVDCGFDMLTRLQRTGETMEDHKVTDRLLLTW